MISPLCTFFPDELRELFPKTLQEPSYRSSQIVDWLYQKGCASYDQMTNLSQALKQKLNETFLFPCLEKKEVLESSDGETTKFLFKLYDNHFVEAVLIRSGKRRTVCISSQVGCPARCSFCASGKQGLIRNLEVAEIVEQVIHINAYLKEAEEKVTHLVFMGMGEPLENCSALFKAIKIFTHPKAFKLSSRRITVSTVGIIEGIESLLSEGLYVNLALSLHAPNQKVRKKIIPSARKYPLEELLKVVKKYGAISKRDITYEYILLSGINDQKEHARELAILLKGQQCCVNLIPYNPVDGLSIQRPNKEVINEFRSVLNQGRIKSTQRYTKGKDIDAACGQLALKRESQYKR